MSIYCLDCKTSPALSGGYCHRCNLIAENQLARDSRAEAHQRLHPDCRCENCHWRGWLDEGADRLAYPCPACMNHRDLCWAPIAQNIHCKRPKNHRGPCKASPKDNNETANLI